jgi:hypothetical protein
LSSPCLFLSSCLLLFPCILIPMYSYPHVLLSLSPCPEWGQTLLSTHILTTIFLFRNYYPYSAISMFIMTLRNITISSTIIKLVTMNTNRSHWKPTNLYLGGLNLTGYIAALEDWFGICLVSHKLVAQRMITNISRGSLIYGIP